MIPQGKVGTAKKVMGFSWETNDSTIYNSKAKNSIVQSVFYHILISLLIESVDECVNS